MSRHNTHKNNSNKNMQEDISWEIISYPEL